jgi:hypothetical protein
MKPAMPSLNIRTFIDFGLAGLVDEIPTLIRDARLQLHTNDIGLVLLVDPDAKHYHSYGKRREPYMAELFMQVPLDTLAHWHKVPPVGEVPVMVFFQDHVFSFLYVLQGTEGVLQ